MKAEQPMQFILKIDLRSDAMQTPKDVAIALFHVAADLIRMPAFDGDSCGIRDAKGNHVGNWKHDYPDEALEILRWVRENVDLGDLSREAVRKVDAVLR